MLDNKITLRQPQEDPPLLTSALTPLPLRDPSVPLSLSQSAALSSPHYYQLARLHTCLPTIFLVAILHDIPFSLVPYCIAFRFHARVH